ncbi:MAG: glycerate kinase [Anaerolineaceae bacterium]|nr:glycerate kinase [Anaerolineaceae bacterium]
MDSKEFIPYLKTLESQEEVSRILASIIEAVDPRESVKNIINYSGTEIVIQGHKYDLDEYSRIFIIGAGKGAQGMVQGLVDILDTKITGGMVIVKHPVATSNHLGNRIAYLSGSHPIPGQESVASTQRLIEFTDNFRKDDLIFCVITGGGSSLLSMPAKGIKIDDLMNLTRQLLFCGAEIGEVNTLRKHFDIVKGGGLARRVYPAKLITLILSDVIGSPVDVIASGPTIADTTSFNDAIQILKKYDIYDKAPENIIKLLIRGQMGEIPETVKKGDPCLEFVQNEVIADNFIASIAALTAAKNEGFNTMLLTTFLRGEASQAGIFLAGILQEIDRSSHPIKRPACIVAGGETTVTVRGSGTGGRNQEVALGAVESLAGIRNIALITFATDGEDGPTNAAGAVVTGDTLKRGLKKGFSPVDFLKNNDSYHYFEAIGDLITIGPTGTNVNDISLLFAF